MTPAARTTALENNRGLDIQCRPVGDGSLSVVARRQPEAPCAVNCHKLRRQTYVATKPERLLALPMQQMGILRRRTFTTGTTWARTASAITAPAKRTSACERFAAAPDAVNIALSSRRATGNQANSLAVDRMRRSH